MTRGKNAQLAVERFDKLCLERGWGPEAAWKGIAVLLLTCNVQRRGWKPLHDVIVFRESNDFKVGPNGPNATVRKAELLTQFLAHELSVPRAELCAFIGRYWRHRAVSRLQQNNLVGHAFRSIVAHVLAQHGGADLRIEEEMPTRDLFEGFDLSTRSKKTALDIVAFRGTKPVAMISTRWRFRHDRVDVVDEALAYATPAARTYGDVPFFAVLGEFSMTRLEKVLDHAPPRRERGPIAAVVHFEPRLISSGLRESGDVSGLKSLDWLRTESANWK